MNRYYKVEIIGDNGEEKMFNDGHYIMEPNNFYKIAMSNCHAYAGAYADVQIGKDHVCRMVVGPREKVIISGKPNSGKKFQAVYVNSYLGTKNGLDVQDQNDVNLIEVKFYQEIMNGMHDAIDDLSSFCGFKDLRCKITQDPQPPLRYGRCLGGNFSNPPEPQIMLGDTQKLGTILNGKTNETFEVGRQFQVYSIPTKIAFRIKTLDNSAPLVQV